MTARKNCLSRSVPEIHSTNTNEQTFLFGGSVFEERTFGMVGTNRRKQMQLAIALSGLKFNLTE